MSNGGINEAKKMGGVGVTTVVRGLENDKKHTLGRRAFVVFLFSRIKFCVFLFAVSLAAWYAERWIPVNTSYGAWAPYVTQLIFALAVAYFVFVFARTYLEYRYYTYLFTEEAFIMTYGYIIRNEIATLYHHIQNVNIERSVMDRMLGLSKVIILMTGSDRDTLRNQIVLPAVGYKKAKMVQSELLRRSRRHAAMDE